MADMRFDTEKMVERLEDAGVPPAQARVHVSLLTNSINATEESILERCASKHQVADNVALLRGDFEKHRSHIDNELEKQRQHLDTEFEKLRLDFQTRLSNTKSDLILMAGTVGVLQMGLITALILKLIP